MAYLIRPRPSEEVSNTGRKHGARDHIHYLVMSEGLNHASGAPPPPLPYPPV